MPAPRRNQFQKKTSYSAQEKISKKEEKQERQRILLQSLAKVASSYATGASDPLFDFSTTDNNVAGTSAEIKELIEKNANESLSEKDQSVSRIIKQIGDLMIKISLDSAGTKNGGILSEQDLEKTLQRTSELLNDCPSLFNSKFGKTIRDYIVGKFHFLSNKMLVTLPPVRCSLTEMVKKYKTVFNSWIDSENCMSFQTKFATALFYSQEYHFSLKDMFVLHLFAMGTGRRTVEDHLLQLAVTGKSTVGKTVLFERPLYNLSSTFCGDEGIGRFNLNGKSIFMCNDVSINKLVTGINGATFKTMCRTEPTKQKVFGTTEIVPVAFIFISANENIQDHNIFIPDVVVPPSTSASALTPYQKVMNNRKNQQYAEKTNQKKKTNVQKEQIAGQYLNVASQLRATKNRNDDENCEALKNRILECYVYERPNVPPRSFPKAGTCFDFHHMNLGLFDRVLDILDAHPLEHHYSEFLYRYCVYGLGSYLPAFLKLHVICDNPEENTKQKLFYIERLSAHFAALKEEPNFYIPLDDDDDYDEEEDEAREGNVSDKKDGEGAQNFDIETNVSSDEENDDEEDQDDEEDFDYEPEEPIEKEKSKNSVKILLRDRPVFGESSRSSSESFFERSDSDEDEGRKRKRKESQTLSPLVKRKRQVLHKAFASSSEDDDSNDDYETLDSHFPPNQLAVIADIHPEPTSLGQNKTECDTLPITSTIQPEFFEDGQHMSQIISLQDSEVQDEDELLYELMTAMEKDELV